MGKVKITETVLRDAHQSLIATRMRTEDMLPFLKKWIISATTRSKLGVVLHSILVSVS